MKRFALKKIFLLLLALPLTWLNGCGESQVNVTISPRTVTVPTDQPFKFTVEVSNTQELGVTWSIDNNDNSSLGTIDPDNGVYNPPDSIPTPNTATIRVTSKADTSATDSVKASIVSGNRLHFGPVPFLVSNLQVTDYSVPSGPCAANCTASTVSAGQHSVGVHHSKHGKYDYTLIYAVWSDNRRQPFYDVFFRQITLKTLITTPPSDPVVTISNTVRINDNLTDSTVPANPSLAVDRSGNVYVAWQTDRPATPSIYANKGKLSAFNDNTVPDLTFTIPNLFSDSVGTFCKSTPSIATDGTKIYVAWQDALTDAPCGNYIIRAAAGAAPADPAPSPPMSYPILPAAYTATGDQTEPTVGLYQNDLYIAWTGNQSFCSGICFTKGRAPTGSITSWSSTAPVLVNDSIGLGNFPVAHFIHPSLAVNSAGTGQNVGDVYVVWQDDRNGKNDIFFAKKDKNGTLFDAVTDPNNFSLHNIRVNDDTVINSFPDNADHRRPSMVVGPPEPNSNSKTASKIYVSWDDTRYTNNGLARRDIITAKSLDGGQNFWENSGPADLPPGTGPAYDSSIAVDDFGRASIIWTDERNPGGGTDVFFAMGQ